jgi:hypothetical protein
MTRRSIILASLLLTASNAFADQFYTSDRFTLRFGIEQDFPMSTRIDNAHADVELNYDAGVELNMFADSPAGVGPISTTHFYGNTNTRFTPASIPPAFAFLGGTVGQTMWVLPQSQFSNRIYLGVDSQLITSADRSEMQNWNPGEPRNSANTLDKYIEMQLIEFRGPAGSSVSLYQTNAQGQPIVHWSSFDAGISEQDTVFVRSVGHQHFNWAFTKSGLYEVDVQLRTLTTVDLLKGDADRDNDVDLADFDRLVQNFGDWGVGWRGGDFTGDGYVDLDDFFLLQQNFGTGSRQSAADLSEAIRQSGLFNVPEPATVASVVAAAFLFAGRRPVSRNEF